MRILLTGATGFLGSAIRESQREAGVHDVWTLQRRGSGQPNEIVADLVDPALAERLPTQIDLIVHAGGFVPEKEGAADLDLSMATNAEATLRLLDYAVKAGAKRFVYVSSAAIYGSLKISGAIAETTEPRPDNPYALSKLAGELMLEPYRFVHGLEVVSLRFSYIYGRGMRATSVVKKFSALAAGGRPIPLFNSGADFFDLVHVSDAVRAVESAMNRGAGVYNIGSGRPTSVLELATTLVEVTGSKSRLEKLPSMGHYHSKYLEISKAASELDWRPQVCLADGLSRL